ncbi:hypothetical protein [Flexithrix dorotheae]|uniref:hypothetical protein n=1 Tax=Flexithrix dorotheae TaxID=70993 RepID=UPI0003649D1A|nr:hypothetical protein [Flexithrix dorotheae]
MGLFNLFSKKDSFKEIKKLKIEIDDQVSRLENFSQTLANQLEAIKQVPLEQFEAKMKTIITSLSKNEEKFNNTEKSIETLKSMENGGEELENQVRIATMNLGALNAVMEMELKDANSNLKALNDSAYNITRPVVEMADLINEIPGFNEALLSLKGKMKAIEEYLEKQGGKV